MRKTKTKISLIHIFLTKMSSENTNTLQKLHISVLLNELVSSIEVFSERKNIVVDATLWMWGHARKIIPLLHPWDIFIWFDADERNLKLAQPALEKEFANLWVELIFIKSNFLHVKKELRKRNITSITAIYYDLWLSSLHLDDGNRWFSFQIDGPLDMRFDTSSWKSAKDVLIRYSTLELTEIFRKYWEERQAYKIAKYIEQARKSGSTFDTTSELKKVISEVSSHPKTLARIFQALRIEVNNEYEALKSSLQDAIDLLEKDGNIFVISFHSGEDRIVKETFRRESKDCICQDLICTCHHKAQLQLVTKKPLTPTPKEIEINPRSRSAKARYAKKI